MPAPDWDDLAEFLDDDEFATPAVIQLQGGGSISLSGIYDDPYLNAQLGEYELDTSQPRFTCIAALVVGVTRGDTLTLHGRTLDILTSPQADGTGMAVLALAPQG